jgi:DNA mismatch repair protein MSH6
LQTGKVTYVTVGKDNYVVEIPKDAVTRYPPPTKGWTEKKGTQKVARYWTDFITQRLRPLAEALEDLALAENHILRRLLMRFDDNKDLWHRIVLKLAEIDCLLSLARVSSSEGMVKPEVVPAAEPILEIRGGKHPCLANKMGSSFVPNDISLSVFDGRAVLLTGPNMGGKSTLLRQVCIGVVMAQIGCYVMADSMKLSPVDRIFTRIGASDNIFEGQSTFLVELLETASVCNFATKNSLVILDELGRGTSTHDGYAIAFAVLDHLLKSVRCRTLFSTHYHKLTNEWKGYEIGRDLQVCHMAALVGGISTTELIQKEAAQDQGDQDRMDVDSEVHNSQDVMFLYQMRAGGCPRSYGLNVAQMADLPASLIQEASRKSEEFFKQMQKSRMCVPKISDSRFGVVYLNSSLKF